MTVRVLFFSHLRDVVGADNRELDLPAGVTTGELLSHLYEQHPRLRDWDTSILIGAGVEFVGRDYVLRESDEIAIMPPVQGG